MNKLLTKIVGLTLGLSMAIGVGVAVAVKGNEAKPVSADSWDETALSSLTSSDIFVIVGNNGKNVAPRGIEPRFKV